MSASAKTKKKHPDTKIEISDEDIYEAMKDIQGYLDITPADMKEVYKFAYRHAFDLISKKITAHDLSAKHAVSSKTADTAKSPPRVSVAEIIWSWVGAFIGIGIIAFANYHIFEKTELLLIIASFGASAVLVFGAIKSPLAQPRNLIGGHILSALVGVGSYQIFHSQLWFASAFAVATAIAVMHATRTLHPPGGATALIAVIGGEKIYNLGFLYTIMPAGGGALIMLIIALLINNIPKNRRYPEFWF